MIATLLLATALGTSLVSDAPPVTPNDTLVPPGPSSTPTMPLAKARFRRVAVYDLQADGIEPRVGRFVTDSLVVELRKLDGISVISTDEVRALIDHDAQMQLLGCDDGKCQSPVGDALGADEILVGTLSTVAGSSVMTLRRIDHNAARAMATVTRRLKPSDGEEFLAEVGPVVDTLFPGHAVRVGQARGVAPERVARLNPPPVPLWAPIAVGSTSLVTLGAAAACGLFALDAESTQHVLLEQSKKEPVPGAVVLDAGARATAFATGANVLYGAAAVVGLGAAAMLPFTNFDAPEADAVE